jgi:hypothetical protein
MPVEEIVLSLPGTTQKSDTRPQANVNTSSGQCDDLVRRYQELLGESLKFAWTKRAQARRAETFETARKSLVKELARESTALVPNRGARLEARTQIYTTVARLLSANAAAHRRLDQQKRLLIRVASVLGLLSIASICGLFLLSQH